MNWALSPNWDLKLYRTDMSEDVEIRIKERPPSYARKRLFFCALAKFIKIFIRPLFTEEMQINGLDNLFEGHAPRKGPFLWLIGHVDLNDFYNYFPLWLELPHRFDTKAVITHEYHHPEAFFSKRNSLLRYLVKKLGSTWPYQVFWNQFTVPFYRTRMIENLSAEEISRQNWHNRKQLEKLIWNYEKGVDIAIFPEATTKTTGEYPKMRIGGIYTLCRSQEDRGNRVEMICIGNTYDLLAGKKNLMGKKLNLVFCNIGEPFKYSPITKGLTESNEEYENNDKAALEKKIINEFADLNTLTVSQLGASFIFLLIKQNIVSFTKEDFVKAIDSQINFLDKIKDGRKKVVFDNALLNFQRKKKRIERFFEFLMQRQYVVMEGNTAFINKDRVKDKPTVIKHYKKENPLLHAYNRISDVARLRPVLHHAIVQALNSTQTLVSGG